MHAKLAAARYNSAQCKPYLRDLLVVSKAYAAALIQEHLVAMRHECGRWSRSLPKRSMAVICGATGRRPLGTRHKIHYRSKYWGACHPPNAPASLRGTGCPITPMQDKCCGHSNEIQPIQSHYKGGHHVPCQFDFMFPRRSYHACVQ